MTPTLTDTREGANIRERAVDAIRQATHVAHDARVLKTAVSDAVEDGVHAARRAVTRGIHNAEDLRDAATTRMRRDPFKMAGLIFGAGVVVGIVGTWLARPAGICKDSAD